MSIRDLIRRTVERGASLLRWEGDALAAGHIPPASVAGTIVGCRCGYRGTLRDVQRWEDFELWIGNCPKCRTTLAIGGRMKEAS